MSGALERHEHRGTVLWGRRDRAELSLRIHLEPGPPADDADARTAEAWDRFTAENPRLFNGPILGLSALDLDTGTLRARRETFRRFMTGEGVELLAVIGVVVARREGGGVCALMGRRGRQTRMYGRRWELAPAGGIDPPHDADARTIEREALLAQLAEEMREEVGLTARVRSARLVAAVRNPEARSLDLVVLIEPEDSVEALRARAREQTWEYERMLWLPVRRAEHFVRTHGEEMTPQTRVLLRYLGWSTI